MRVRTTGKRLFDSLLRIIRKGGDAYVCVRPVVIRRYSSLREWPLHRCSDHEAGL